MPQKREGAKARKVNSGVPDGSPAEVSFVLRGRKGETRRGQLTSSFREGWRRVKRLPAGRRSVRRESHFKFGFRLINALRRFRSIRFSQSLDQFLRRGIEILIYQVLYIALEEKGYAVVLW